MDVIETLTGFTTAAIRTAHVYCTHSGRKSITEEDIKRALKLECVVFFKIESNQELCKNLENLGEDIEEDIINDDYVPFCESECDCQICLHMNNIDELWDKFEPENHLQIIMKKHIDGK